MKTLKKYFFILFSILIFNFNVLGLEKYAYIKRLPKDSSIKSECSRAEKSWNPLNERRQACNKIEKFLRSIDDMYVDEIIAFHNKLEGEFTETTVYLNVFTWVSQVLGLLKEYSLNSKLNEIEMMKQLLHQLKNERIKNLKKNDIGNNNEDFKQLLAQLKNEEIEELKKNKAKIDSDLEKLKIK